MRLLLVDDQPAFRAGLRDLLASVDGVEVVGEAGDGERAVEMMERLRPDAVLMDVRMPKVDGIEATRAIRSRHPNACILVLTTFDEDDLVASAIRAGAMGYLLKGTPVEEIVEIVRLALRGYTAIGPGARAGAAADAEAADIRLRAGRLSERERDVWQRIGEGATNREIAAALFLSEGTVKNYVTTILATLGVRHRTLAALYWRLGGRQ